MGIRRVTYTVVTNEVILMPSFRKGPRPSGEDRFDCAILSWLAGFIPLRRCVEGQLSKHEYGIICSLGVLVIVVTYLAKCKNKKVAAYMDLNNVYCSTGLYSEQYD